MSPPLKINSIPDTMLCIRSVLNLSVDECNGVLEDSEGVLEDSEGVLEDDPGRKTKSAQVKDGRAR